MRLLVLIAIATLGVVSPALAEPLSFAEDCALFEPRRVEPRFLLGAEAGHPKAEISIPGGERLTFPTHDEARRAMEIIRHHGFNQQCFIGRGRGGFMYWKNGSSIPSTSFLTGEDCLTFRTDAVRVGGGDRGHPYILWDTTGPGGVLASFGSSSEHARQALELVRHYELDHVCYVGRPHASMTYWRARLHPPQRGESPPPPR